MLGPNWGPQINESYIQKDIHRAYVSPVLPCRKIDKALLFLEQMFILKVTMDRDGPSESFFLILRIQIFKVKITVIDCKTLREIICFCSSTVKCFLLKVKMSKLVPYRLLLGIGLSCF